MMNRFPSISKRSCRTLAVASIVAGVCTFPAARADAHFVLEAPASWMSQGQTGLPEKLGPCGNEGGGTETGTVTTYAPGDTVTITIDEVIFHPGHYRVALATTQDGLPAEPPVTAGATPCDSTVIQSPAVYPILADGLFVHTEPFTAPQTATVTLPTDVTCTNCTLQVIEFMGDHALNNPGGCFYHHCANIAISATALGDGGTSTGSSSSGATSSSSGATSSGGGASSSRASSSASGAASAASSGGTTTAGAGGAGTGEGPSMSSGCKCSMPGAGAPASLGSLVVLAALLRRRRR